MVSDKLPLRNAVRVREVEHRFDARWTRQPRRPTRPSGLPSRELTFKMAVADYSPARPGPSPIPVGRICSLHVHRGCLWDALASILLGEVAIPGALVTGTLLFVAVATVGFMLAG